MSIGLVVGSQYRITYLFDCHRKMIFSDIRSCMGRSGLPRVPSRPQTIPFDAPEACTKFCGRAWPGSKWVNLGPFAKMHYGTGEYFRPFGRGHPFLNQPFTSPEACIPYGPQALYGPASVEKSCKKLKRSVTSMFRYMSSTN